MELDLYMFGSEVDPGEPSLSEFYSMETLGRIWPCLKSKGEIQRADTHFRAGQITELMLLNDTYWRPQVERAKLSFIGTVEQGWWRTILNLRLASRH
jgi:hypothetical protein